MPSRWSQSPQQAGAVLAQQWEEQVAMRILGKLTSTLASRHATLLLSLPTFLHLSTIHSLPSTIMRLVLEYNKFVVAGDVRNSG